MRKLLIALTLLLGTYDVIAQADIDLEDFANAVTFEIDGQAPMYRLSLPASVYAGVTRSDLGDLRVFNGAGAVVPHALRLPPAAKRSVKAKYPLPLFVLRDVTADSNTYRLSLRRGKGFESLDIRETTGAQERTSGYLLDARGTKQRLESIVFDWDEPTPETGLLFRVDIEAGNDLERWRNVASNVSLAELSYLGKKLRKNTVNITAGRYSFYRLKFRKPETAPRLIAAHGIRAVVTERFTRVWRDVTVSKGSAAGEYLFSNITGMRVYAADVGLPELNTLVNGTFYSRAKGIKQWRRRHSGQLYRLSVGDGEVSNDPLGLGGSLDEEWKLEIDQGGGGIGASLPSIRLSWQPHELVFVARGQPPFRLAYGSSTVEPVSRGAADPFQHMGKSTLGVAVLGAQVEHPGGDAALTKPIDWRRIVLWATLIGGALLIIVLAVRLLQRMNA